jgi:hypothetical protein
MEDGHCDEIFVAPSVRRSGSWQRTAVTAAVATASLLVLGAVFSQQHQSGKGDFDAPRASIQDLEVKMAIGGPGANITACNQFLTKAACQPDRCTWEPDEFTFEKVENQPKCLRQCKMFTDELTCEGTGRCSWQYSVCVEKHPRAKPGLVILDGKEFEVRAPDDWNCDLCMSHLTPGLTEDNDAWGTSLAVVDRKWCGTACNMRDNCVAFLYPFLGNSKQCAILTPCVKGKGDLDMDHCSVANKNQYDYLERKDYHPHQEVPIPRPHGHGGGEKNVYSNSKYLADFQHGMSFEKCADLCSNWVEACPHMCKQKRMCALSDHIDARHHTRDSSCQTECMGFNMHQHHHCTLFGEDVKLLKGGHGTFYRRHITKKGAHYAHHR